VSRGLLGWICGLEEGDVVGCVEWLCRKSVVTMQYLCTPGQIRYMIDRA
jgi:hypothetical protein